ncbi:MAG: hypothetical protein EZS28_046866, partial [Streblomastix strix]
MQDGRVDVKLANVLSCGEEKGGTKMIQDARKRQTHVGIALTFFSKMREVSIEMKNGRELMRKAMALLVAFSATRMTELAAITRKCLTQQGQNMKIITVIKKRKKYRENYYIKRTRGIRRLEFGGIMIEEKFQE